MKTRSKFMTMIGCVALVLSFLFAAVGCGGDPLLSVTFDYNYEGAPAAYVQEVEKGTMVTPPADPVRDGYAFTGWFTDEDASVKADFGYGITESKTFYAGWRQTAVTVTFDPNREGGERTTVPVTIGSAVAQPQDPVWDDAHLFTGWFTDEDCSVRYDFTAPVTEALTLYAGWEEADLSDTVLVTFSYNFDGAPNGGVYYSTRVKKGRLVGQPSDPVRDGYGFIGWYADAECTTRFNFTSTSVTEQTRVYAYWLKEWAFEAEYTDVSGIEGHGYSGEPSGTDIILRDAEGALGAGNGFYVTYLYGSGIELVFEIEAEEAVQDAVLELSLAAEQADVVLSSSNYTVQVNETKLSFSTISLLGAETAPNKAIPFEKFTISMSVRLEKGNNVIRLITSNNTPMKGSAGNALGTMYATAPMIDCLYLYTDTQLDWAEGKCFPDNIKGK